MLVAATIGAESCCVVARCVLFVVARWLLCAGSLASSSQSVLMLHTPTKQQEILFNT
jgi:hypothetical protein